MAKQCAPAFLVNQMEFDMTKFLTGVSAAVLLGGASVAMANSPANASSITEEEVRAAQQAWGEGIVQIGSVFSAGGDYEQAARDHIEKFYAYEGDQPILFKPTLAAEDQFRGSFDEALSYFVGGSIAEDGGFAIAPYTNVRWENEGTIIDSDSAMAMGNYFFTTTEGNEVKVEYTFGYVEDENGDLKIVLHHSSIPYSPAG